jgi:serine-type D-Ala-D-Ala carboxypeptidase/endopeptidase (penicillin-binding protein 4)
MLFLIVVFAIGLGSRSPLCPKITVPAKRTLGWRQQQRAMLDLLSSGLISLGLQTIEVNTKPIETLTRIAGMPGFVLPSSPDSATTATLKAYLQQLETQGMMTEKQGLWFQSSTQPLAENRGTRPLPAASITKIATTLAALNTWEPDRTFTLQVQALGSIQGGVLQGDLIVSSPDAMVLTWQDAIAIGNQLTRLGLKRVEGNLAIETPTPQSSPEMVGQLLQKGLNWAFWHNDFQSPRIKLSPGTPKPNLEISGRIVTDAGASSNARFPTPLLDYRSVPLGQILKEMNVYSSNEIAQMLADAMGGGATVASKAARAAGVPSAEVELINGSGLTDEKTDRNNQISPRAACAMLMAIQRHLQAYGLNVGDAFPVMGRDVGTLEDRHMPAGTVVKTGTLWNVSALVGVLSTQQHGLVWFAIVNGGDDYVGGFRQQQDTLLQRLQAQWGGAFPAPAAIKPRDWRG